MKDWLEIQKLEIPLGPYISASERWISPDLPHFQSKNVGGLKCYDRFPVNLG